MNSNKLKTLSEGDVVSVATEALDSLKYVPGFPEEITSHRGKITSIWRVVNTDEKYVTVSLDICPNISNLQFHVNDIEVIVPAEVDYRLSRIEAKLGLDKEGSQG